MLVGGMPSSLVGDIDRGRLIGWQIASGGKVWGVWESCGKVWVGWENCDEKGSMEKQ